MFRQRRTFQIQHDANFDVASTDFRAALRNDPKDETTISFFNDLERRNPAGASRSDSDRQSENYANELTDWGIPQQSELKMEVGSQTPLIIPGGRRVMTGEVTKLINTEAVTVDVLRDNTGGHRTLPGAKCWESYNAALRAM